MDKKQLRSRMECLAERGYRIMVDWSLGIHSRPLGLRCIFRTRIWRGLSVQHFPLKFVDLLQITRGGVRGVAMYGWQLPASHFRDKAREA